MAGVAVPDVAPQVKGANQGPQVDTTVQPDGKTNKTVYPHTFQMLPLHRVNDLLQQAVGTALQTKVANAGRPRGASTAAMGFRRLRSNADST